VSALAEGLKLTREAIARSANEPDALHVLRIKEMQFEGAISAALGLELSAFADPNPAPGPESAGRGGGRAGVATMTAPIPGQTFGVKRAFHESRDDADPDRERPGDFRCEAMRRQL